MVFRLRHERADFGGGGTPVLNVFKVDVTNFVNQFLVGYFAPVMAAWLVLRGVVEIAEGRSPLYSILGAMFLLSIPATQALLQGWNSGTKFATADVLAGLWTYTASRILPVAAGLAIIGAILNFAFGKPALRLHLLRGRVPDGVRSVAAGCLDDVTR